MNVAKILLSMQLTVESRLRLTIPETMISRELYPRTNSAGYGCGLINMSLHAPFERSSQ